MKKPTLRFRQVFEHPTHFKVTKPLGNPLIIAKQGLSEGMQNRLRKFAEGGEATAPADEATLEDFPTPPPAEVIKGVPFARAPNAPTVPFAGRESESRSLEDINASIEQLRAMESEDEEKPVKDIPDVTTAPESSDLEIPTEPAAPPESAAPVLVKPVSDDLLGLTAEQQKIYDETFAGAKRLVGAEYARKIAMQQAKMPVAESVPAAAQTPAAVVVTTEPAAAPVALVTRTPAEIGEAARQSYLEQVKAEEATALVQQKLQAIQQEKLAQNAAAEAEQAMLKANQAVQTKIAELAKFDEGKPSTASDIARSIGSALSVAAGAFASGMTGMPNFALQIYNNAIDRDLVKQREQRNSIVDQLKQLGMDQKDAEKYYRSQLDTYTAAQLARMGASTPNPKARAEMIKTAAQIGTNATKAAAEVERNLNLAKKAEAETAAIPLETEVKQLDLARKIDADRMDAINKVLDRAAKKEISANELAVKIKEINSTAALKKQELSLKGKEMAAPEGAEEMSEYQKLKTAFKAEGNKGLAKEVAQTFSVDGVKLLARSEEDAKEKQKLWRGYSSSEKAVDDLVKEIDSMKFWDSLTPTQRAARVESLAAKFAVGYPKSEGFQRALSVADKDVVLKGVLQDPTSFKSWLLGLSSASVKALKQAMEEDKIDMLKNDVVEGDPRLQKLLEPKTKEAKYKAMTPGQVAGQ